MLEPISRIGLPMMSKIDIHDGKGQVKYNSKK
jgi:hypothetical protein